MASPPTLDSPSSPFSITDALLQIQSFLPPLPSSSSSSSSSITTTAALPSPQAIHAATAAIQTHLPTTGIGASATIQHVLQALTPGFSGSKNSAAYYGFVTGGALPVAEAADRVITAWDQNVQVHAPAQGTGMAAAVEWAAAGMLLSLLGLGEDGDGDGDDVKGGARWRGRVFTTGATASNVLGLACGREAVLRWRLRGRGGEPDVEIEDDDDGTSSVGELGLLEACRLAGVDAFQVLTTLGHSSLSKAASIVGLGRQSVKDVGLPGLPWRFDVERLEGLLKRPRTGSIVVVSCGEVNTGRYATRGLAEMKRLRELCDRYGAWLHVDGAFGIFARALPAGDEFVGLKESCEGIELADSITGDAHKCLNVPYDCGFFLTPSLPFLTSVFRNPNAAYLSTTTTLTTIPSPLHIGIENSRRFRGLPVYSVLLAHGRSGLSEMFARQVRLARLIAAFVDAHPGYELLPPPPPTPDLTSSPTPAPSQSQTGIIVLFRARDPALNADLAARINRSCKIMVSGTAWDGQPAVRIAVSTWMVQEDRDLEVVSGVLEEALLL